MRRFISLLIVSMLLLGAAGGAPFFFGQAGQGEVLTFPVVSDLYARYRSEDLAGADAAAVATWIDSSGNGRDLIQPTNAFRPTKKTGIIAGRSVARCDGGDDFLRTAVALNVPSTTVIFVGRQNATAAQYCRFFNLFPGDACVFRDASDDGWGMYCNSFGARDSAAPMGSFHVVSAVFSDSAGSLAVDGVSTSGNVSSASATVLALGGSYSDGDGSSSQFLPCDIAEVLIYSRALTGPERASLETYLGAKYGITITH